MGLILLDSGSSVQWRAVIIMVVFPLFVLYCVYTIAHALRIVNKKNDEKRKKILGLILLGNVIYII